MDIPELHDIQAVRKVTSNQQGPHDNLPSLVIKHQQHSFRRPIANHTLHAFEQLQQSIDLKSRPIILDSGCGTALSTRHIAKHYPDSWVIGVDRSDVRLSKQYDDTLPDNAITLQADLIDFWRLAVKANWQLQHHFILYPNPYPKSVHLKRRWHAHPVFPAILTLGGQLELRTNWGIYAEEFALALQLSGQSAIVDTFNTSDYWTLFEKKYAQSGQTLYRCCVDLSP